MRHELATAVICGWVGLASAGDLPRPVTAEAFSTPGVTSVLLGRDLFFDPILSGNRNIACASCHSPDHATGDGVSLTLGQGAQGLGADRRAPAQTPAARIARHTPALFNLGAHEFTRLFHDGRVEKDDGARFGVRLPDGSFLERPVQSALAAQALMPRLQSRSSEGT